MARSTDRGCIYGGAPHIVAASTGIETLGGEVKAMPKASNCMLFVLSG